MLFGGAGTSGNSSAIESLLSSSFFDTFSTLEYSARLGSQTKSTSASAQSATSSMLKVFAFLKLMLS